MQTRKLFIMLWRINAIIILLVGLIAGAVLSVAGYLWFQEITRTRHVNNVANTAPGDVLTSADHLGSFEPVPGSATLRAPLTVRQTYALRSGSKDAGSVRNYLYFDSSKREAHWLRPSMDSVILSSISLPDVAYGEKKKDAVVYVHVTVDKDTNGDDRLTESDAKQIAISSPNGRSYRVLVNKADQLNEATLLPSGRLLILYTADKKLAAIELDPSDIASPVDAYEVPTAIK